MNGKNLNLAFSTEKIYEDANFHIEENDKVGVVGVNGAGKTTLVKSLLGPEAGKLRLLNADRAADVRILRAVVLEPQP